MKCWLCGNEIEKEEDLVIMRIESKNEIIREFELHRKCAELMISSFELSKSFSQMFKNFFSQQ